MGCGYFYPSEEYPDDIHQNGQAPSVIASGCHFTAERPKCKHRHFKQLQTERDTYYSNAEQNTAQHIIQTYENSSENHPEDVADKIHIRLFYKSVIANMVTVAVRGIERNVFLYDIYEYHNDKQAGCHE